jgi:hypothetical protein
MNIQETEECAECVVPAAQNSNDAESLLCVTCPFCHQTVTAILTKENITCPKCRASVNRQYSAV